MQNTASVPTDQFSDLLKRLPAGLDLDTLARETKAIQRDRKIGGGANLLRLALARGPGGFSLRQSSGWVSLLEIAELSNPGVHYRLKQAVGFLAAVVARLLAAKVPGANLRWPGRTLRLADGTWEVGPASDRMGVRLFGDERLGATDSDTASRGMVTGAVQVPPDGEPVILLTDHATLGGYSVVAVVAAADLGRLGQCVPGAPVVLEPIDHEQAAAAWRAHRRRIEGAAHVDAVDFRTQRGMARLDRDRHAGCLADGVSSRRER